MRPAQATLPLQPPVPGNPPYFHNTARLRGEAKARAHQAARGQELRVLAVLEDCWPHGAAASTVLARLERQGSKMLIQSVRRSLTNLKTRKLARKTTQQRPGPHGAPEYLYRVNR